MKKLMKATVAAGALALVATPAMADNFLFWEVLKLAEYTIVVDVTKEKIADINVNFDEELEGSASSQALVNARVEFNSNSNGSTNEANSTQRTAILNNGVNENLGIGQLNQDVGQFSNQGNVASVGLDLGGDAYTMAEAYVDQKTQSNFSGTREGIVNTANPNLESLIYGSVNENTGVFHVNQNSGVGNQQHNVLSAAVGASAVIALADAGLGQLTAGNSLADTNTVKRDVLSDSVNGNTGIVNVNQSVGTFNSQATIVNVSALTSAVGL
jgi:hypothetical protein